MKTKELSNQDRFTLALHATWSVLRDPVRSVSALGGAYGAPP